MYGSAEQTERQRQEQRVVPPPDRLRRGEAERCQMGGQPEDSGVDQGREIDVVRIVDLCVQSFTRFRDVAGKENVDVGSQHAWPKAQKRALRNERQTGSPDADPIGAKAILRTAAQKLTELIQRSGLPGGK